MAAGTSTTTASTSVGGAAPARPVGAARRPTLIALAVGMAAALVTGCGDDAPAAVSQAREVARSAGFSEEVAEFFALSAREATATYAAEYATADASGGAATMVVLQRGEDRSVEVRSSQGSARTLRSGGVVYQCVAEQDTWQCAEAGAAEAGTAFADSAVRQTIDALIAQRDQFHLTVRTDEILGVSARCMTSTARGGQGGGVFCVAPSGAPLLVESGQAILRATRYSTTVDAKLLEPPRP